MPENELEERLLSTHLQDPGQADTLGVGPEYFSNPYAQTAFRTITEVFQVYGLQRNFLSLLGEAMNRLDFIRNGPVSPHKYLERINRLETTAQGLDCLAAQLKANSPRLQSAVAQELENTITDRILAALQNSRELTRTDIHNLFGRHKTRAQLQQAINSLINHGLVVSMEKRTPGRSVEQFKAKKSW